MNALDIVGQGSVGTALHRALRAAGVAASIHAARALPPRLDAPIYLLCVRDPMIEDITRAILGRHVGDAPVMLHTAGAVPSARLRAAGASSAALMHPLLAFAPGRTPTLTGALFAIEGDGRARASASRIVEKLGGRVVELEALQLARYHAAAALASNHVLALVDLAREILGELGVEQASRGLASLLGSVADNVGDPALPQALTGPIARGDVAAVQAHLAALGDHPAAHAAYVALAPRLIEIARQKGAADPAALETIAEILAPVTGSKLYPPASLD